MSDLLYLDPLPGGIRYLRDDEFERLQAKGETPPKPVLKARPGGSFEQGTSHINLKCETCRGRGTFRFWTPDRADVGTYVCPCLDQWTLTLALKNAGVDLLYQRFWWADLTREIPVPETYLTDPLRHVRAGRGLALLGDSGTGKTLISSLILKGMLGLGVDGYFTTFNNMIQIFSDGWKDKEDAVFFHNRIKGAKVLVIDDMGKENKSRGKDMVRALVDEVFRHRVASGRATIISSNQTLEEMTEAYGSGLRSLLSEGTVFFSFAGDNYRPTWNEEQLQEQEHGLVRPITLGGKRAVYSDESDGEPTLLDFG